MYVCMVFLIGLIVGSFLNVCIYRIPRKMNIVIARSKCPDCHHRLSFIDMVPLLSFLIQRGRCQYCHQPISFRYPLVEFLNALAWVMAYLKFQISITFFIHIIFTSILIMAACIDIDTMEVMDSTHLLILGLAFVMYFNQDINWMQRFIAALALPLCLMVFNLIYLCIRHCFGIGLGDIKLLFVCGFLLGFPTLLIGFFIAVFTACIYSIYLLFHRSKATIFPMVPFLSIGIFLSSLYSNQILFLYVRLFS